MITSFRDDADDDDSVIAEGRRLFTIAFSKPLQTSISIRVFQGGKWSPQSIPFVAAVNMVHRNGYGTDLHCSTRRW